MPLFCYGQYAHRVMTFSFTTGDVVYVTGNARRLISGEARTVISRLGMSHFLERRKASMIGV